MYFIDSTTQQIDAFDLDLATERIEGRWPFAYVDPSDGLPDGLTVDGGGRSVGRFGGGFRGGVDRLELAIGLEARGKTSRVTWRPLWDSIPQWAPAQLDAFEVCATPFKQVRVRTSGAPAVAANLTEPPQRMRTEVGPGRAAPGEDPAFSCPATR